MILGKLKLVGYRVEHTRNLKWKHTYLCFCGKEFIAIGADVNSKRVKSCGCWRSYVCRTKATRHGMTKTTEHRAWVEMRRRCYDSTRPGYEDYGGRGISVCEEWRDSFESFYSYMGPRPQGKYSLDRIDNNGNYEPGNCRWATTLEQAHNKRPRKDYISKGFV